MATISHDQNTLRVTLSTGERVAGLLRGDVEVPLERVSDVTVHQDGLGAVRGIRAPGLAIPHRVKIGTWRGKGRRSLVSVRRDVPALRVTLAGGSGFDELLVSTRDAATVARALRDAAGLPS